MGTRLSKKFCNISVHKFFNILTTINRLDRVVISKSDGLFLKKNGPCGLSPNKGCQGCQKAQPNPPIMDGILIVVG